MTTDALLTQRTLCKEVLKHQADYALPVKENQKQMFNDIRQLFEPLSQTDTPEVQAHGSLPQVIAALRNTGLSYALMDIQKSQKQRDFSLQNLNSQLNSSVRNPKTEYPDYLEKRNRL